MNANAAFLSEETHGKVPASVAALLATHWLEVPTSDAKGLVGCLRVRDIGRSLASERGTLTATKTQWR